MAGNRLFWRGRKPVAVQSTLQNQQSFAAAQDTVSAVPVHMPGNNLQPIAGAVKAPPGVTGGAGITSLIVNETPAASASFAPLVGGAPSPPTANTKNMLQAALAPASVTAPPTPRNPAGF